MNRIWLPLALAACAAAPAQAQHWGYDGHEGPENWREMSEDWAVCATGQQQSPVNLTDALEADFAAAAIDWADETAGVVVDNGHTVQVNVENAGGVTIGGTFYRLLQFHFHAASEHTINGRHAPMEVHFVHQSEAGDLAVIGVMVERGDSLAALDSVWAAMPADSDASPGIAARVHLNDFLPTDQAAFRYQGSLTTPPCSEIVSWTVLTHPVTATPEQIDSFEMRHPDSFRPVQPLNRRYVLVSDE
ncbi:carbonic anhydrase family protein [uncultured Maricaulis sp.]|uniref:carbonic anhydrase n=1 Tax=uncultured Maricaulis sp. TaxID=174710 RepID=UPI0030D7E124